MSARLPGAPLPAPPRPVQPEPDPERLVLFAVEASISDASRALARARKIKSPYREKILQLEELVALLSKHLIEEATR